MSPSQVPEIAQDAAQLGDKGLRVFRRIRRSGLDTISMSATPERLEVDQGHGRVLVMDRLAGVLLEMQPLDADDDALSGGKWRGTSPSPTIGDLDWLIW